MTALEERVARLEREVQEIQQTHTTRMEAIGFSVTRVHAEIAEFRDETRATLAEILRRLPEAPAQE